LLRSSLINELNPYRLQGLRGQGGGATLFGELGKLKTIIKLKSLI